MIKFIGMVLLVLNLQAIQIVEFSGDKGYPPYSYEENGEAKGIYVDVLKTAFSKIKEYEIKFNMVAYKRAILMVKSGKSVAFFPPYYSKERTQWTKFSTPILAEKTIVFAKKDFLQSKTNYPEDFYGSTVCLNRGFNQSLLGGDNFAKAIKNNKITLIEANDNKACLNRVARGVADFYINDQLIDTSMFKGIIKGMTAKDNFGHVGFTLKKENYPYLDDLEIKFNNIIKQMKKNGEIDQIVNKYK